MELEDCTRPKQVDKNPESRTDCYGEFEIHPLERGYGITVGNALRRVLLSSVGGVAVWGMRIDGVLDELSTFPGVIEDVPEIVMNMKSLVFAADWNYWPEELGRLSQEIGAGLQLGLLQGRFRRPEAANLYLQPRLSADVS